MGAMETRPAIRETRWREDRLRGRGDEGDREEGVHEEVVEVGGQGEGGREWTGEVVVMRREKELVGVRQGEWVDDWRGVSAAGDSQYTGSTGEHGARDASLLWSFQ